MVCWSGRCGCLAARSLIAFLVTAHLVFDLNAHNASNWTQLKTASTVSGTYTLAGRSFNCSDYDSQIVIGNGVDVTILGNGAVLDAARNGRFFQVNSGASLSLSSLTLQNGRWTDHGGAIFSEGYLQICSSKFEHNAVTLGSGGGIYVHHDSATSVALRVYGSTFTGNSAKGGGAAMISYGPLELFSSTFTYGQATNGGAISLGCPSTGPYVASIHDCIFYSNLATSPERGSDSFALGCGGAIHNMVVLHINSSTFEGNSVNATGPPPQWKGEGGAIYNAGTMHINNTAFKNNEVHSHSSVAVGGAICNTGNGNLAIENSHFQFNKQTADGKFAGYASGGGAIYDSGSHSAVVTIGNTRFTTNSAVSYGDPSNTVSGGAIFLYGLTTVIISSTNFTGNSDGEGAPDIWSGTGRNVTFIACNGTGIPMTVANRVPVTDCCTCPTLPTCPPTPAAMPVPKPDPTPMPKWCRAPTPPPTPAPAPAPPPPPPNGTIDKWSDLATACNLPGTFTLPLVGPVFDCNYDSEIAILNGTNVTILGNGARLDAGGKGRFFYVNADASLTLDSLTLKSGCFSGGHVSYVWSVPYW